MVTNVLFLKSFFTTSVNLGDTENLSCFLGVLC